MGLDDMERMSRLRQWERQRKTGVFEPDAQEVALYRDSMVIKALPTPNTYCGWVGAGPPVHVEGGDARLRLLAALRATQAAH